MPGNVIGEAVITVGADASKFESGVRSQTDPAGKSIGKSFMSGMGDVLVAGAVVAGTAVASVIGVSLKQGFARLDAIDQATHKLTGLGHSAGEVQTIMDSALASVKGTAFGLGDAATLAATAVASGIKPGAELTRTLKLTADTATIAGTSLGEMGAIFAKVAAGGKVTGEVIGQLQDRGVPALQFLAQSMGKTVPEVSKLVSAGKIGFPEFQAAMEKGLGGAALASGDTFSGAMANVKAALGRVGAAFLSPAFSQGSGIFKSLIPIIDSLAPSATKLGEAFGKMVSALTPLISKVSEFISKTSGASGLGAVLNIFKEMAPILGPIVGLFTSLGGVKLAGMLGPLGALVPALNPILGILLGLVATSPEVQKALGQAFSSILPVLQSLGTELSGAMQTLAPAFAQVMAALAPLIPMLVNALLPVFTALMPIIPTVAVAIAQLAPVIVAVVAALMPFVQMILQLASGALVQVASALTSVVIAIAPFLPYILGAVGAFLAITKAISIFTTVLSTLRTVVMVASMAFRILGLSMLANPVGLIIAGVVLLVAAFIWLWNNVEGFRNFFIGAWAWIQAAAAAVVAWFTGTFLPGISSVWDAITGAVGTVIASLQAFWAGVVAVFTTIWTTISTVMTNIGNFLTAVWNTITMVFQTAFLIIFGLIILFGQFIWSQISVPVLAVRDFLVAAWSYISSFIADQLNFIMSVVSAVWNGIVSFIGSVISTISSIITSGWNAIRSVVSTVMSAISSVVSSVWNALVGIVSGPVNAIRGVVQSGFDAARSIISSIVGTLSGIVSGAFNAVVGAIRGAVGAVGGAVSSVASAITSGLSGIAGSMASIGGDIVRGLVNGIKAGVGAVAEAARGLASSAISAAKSALGIGSPSKVFAEVGVNTGKGFIQGMDKMASPVESSVAGVFGGLGGVVPLTGAGDVGAGGAAGLGGTTIGTINLTISVDDLAKMTKIGDFLDMLSAARVTSRKSARSGMVAA